MATLVRPRSEDFFAKMSCHEEKAWFRSAPGTRLPLVDLTPKYLTLVATTPGWPRPCKTQRQRTNVTNFVGLNHHPRARTHCSECHHISRWQPHGASLHILSRRLRRPILSWPYRPHDASAPPDLTHPILPLPRYITLPIAPNTTFSLLVLGAALVECACR